MNKTKNKPREIVNVWWKGTAENAIFDINKWDGRQSTNHKTEINNKKIIKSLRDIYSRFYRVRCVFSLLSAFSRSLSLSLVSCHCVAVNWNSQFSWSVNTKQAHIHSFCHFTLHICCYRNERIIMERMSRWAHTTHTQRTAMKMTLTLTLAGKHPMQIFNPYIYSIKWKMNDKHTHEWRLSARSLAVSLCACVWLPCRLPAQFTV